MYQQLARHRILARTVAYVALLPLLLPFLIGPYNCCCTGTSTTVGWNHACCSGDERVAMPVEESPAGCPRCVGRDSAPAVEQHACSGEVAERNCSCEMRSRQPLMLDRGVDQTTSISQVAIAGRGIPHYEFVACMAARPFAEPDGSVSLSSPQRCALLCSWLI